MLNPNHVTKVVRETLKKLGEVEISVEKLIRGTFLIESNFESLFDHSNQYNRKRGLMMLSDLLAKDILTEYIRFRPKQKKQLLDICNIDLDKMPLERILDELETNIVFMVVMTYFVYQSQWVEAPADNLEDIAHCYKKYFVKEYGLHNATEFTEKYKKTFVNK
jgi:hypothetical protein